MKTEGNHNYYVYIITNTGKTVLYIGITNDLHRRLIEHYEESGKQETFTGKYYCYHLLYYEWFGDVNTAIAREKQLKRWSRKKKEMLINRVNPTWKFASEIFFEDRMNEFCGNCG